MGGGGQSQTTQEHKEVKLPPWVDAQAQANLALANQIADKPYEAYGGPTVAGLTPDWKTARGKLAGLDDYYGNYADATAALKKNLGYDPRDIAQRSITAPTMKDVDISTYMNPYTQQVTTRTAEAMRQQGELAQRHLLSQASMPGGGGLGNSRTGIQAGVQGAKTVDAIGDKVGELNMAGFDQATKLAQTDLARRYEAAKQTGDWQQAAEIASRGQDLTAHGQDIQAAEGLAKTADQAQAARLNEMASYLGFGQMQQEQTQREYDDKASKWQKEHDYDLTRLNILLSTLGLTPYGHTETGTSTTRSKGGGGGIGEAMGLGKSLIGLLGAFGSDRSLKTNIEPLGKDPSTGLPMFLYDYKSDVNRSKKTKTPMGPKRAGVMAQDVERIAPHLVRKVSGKRIIDLSSVSEEA